MPNRQLAGSVVLTDDVAAAADLSVTVAFGTGVDGRSLGFVFTWGCDQATTLPADVVEFVTDDTLPAGKELELGAWGCRVFVSEDPTTIGGAR